MAFLLIAYDSLGNMGLAATYMVFYYNYWILWRWKLGSFSMLILPGIVRFIGCNFMIPLRGVSFCIHQGTYMRFPIIHLNVIPKRQCKN